MGGEVVFRIRQNWVLILTVPNTSYSIAGDNEVYPSMHFSYLLLKIENGTSLFRLGLLFPKPFEFRCGQIIMYSQRNVSGSGI